MTDTTAKPSNLAKALVMGAVALGVIAIFGSSMFYRFENPELQKQMRQQAPAGMGGQASSGEGGMPSGMMDMDGVREMLDGLEKRIEENPKDLDALMQAANIYMMRQDKETALDYLGKARELGGDDPQTLMQLSRLFFDLGEFEMAKGTIETILKNDPNDMFAHFNLGVILKYRLDNKVAAEEHFRIVVESEHGFEDLRTEAKKELE